MSDQHKLLSIDGGGIRGVLALEILAEWEKQLAAAHNVPQEDYRLCHFFDYVSGTSTGAVVAACIARGMKVSEIMDFYVNQGTTMFDNRLTSKIKSWLKHQSRYDAMPLAAAMRDMFGAETTLEPGNLECLFMAVTRNQTTDSPWPISSNPAAKYNDINRKDCNLKIPLWRIVRASTAAPGAFQPEDIQWDPNDATKKFMFVDGGVTPYNNSAWLLYRMATEPRYELGWPTGEDKLMVVSVGTGTSSKGDHNILKQGTGVKVVAKRLVSVAGAMIQATMVDQDTCCRQVGRCVYGADLDREIGDMIPRDDNGQTIPLTTDLGRKFLYARYNAHLEQESLDELGLSDIKAEHVKDLGSTEYIPELRRVGRRIAEDVDVQNFAHFLPGSH